MGKNKEFDYSKYTPLGMTKLGPKLPIKFSYDDYLLETLPNRITTDLEEEFMQLGIRKNSLGDVDLELKQFGTALKASMRTYPFLVQMERGDRNPSINVSITDNVLVTIYPGRLETRSFSGVIRSVKTEGTAYDNIKKAVRNVEEIHYLEMVRRVKNTRTRLKRNRTTYFTENSGPRALA